MYLYIRHDDFNWILIALSRKNAKKELGRIFKRVFHLNAFQVRQGKGTSNNGKHF